MKTALIQTTLIWENAEANRQHFAEKINSITENVDLIVLPEMFSTGFSMQPKPIAETMAGETALWMKSLAETKNAAITGSIVISENGHFYNRLLFVLPSGEIHHYDKRHLFSLAGEHETYSKGQQRLVVDFRGFKICPLICYDLRFPVFSRNTEHFDVLLYVANWPKPRITAWDALLKARAIENMCYVIGVNRVGEDVNAHQYTGHSQVLDFLGNVLTEIAEKETVLIADLQKGPLLETRSKLSFLEDRDNFEVLF
ncbi:amidohydrolase [Flavobacterium pallidum]|uniref:Omega-amidase YafV n=1 Tax=Flavobacterium pallidum TaxID=2172098 RepID=A0A2S1SLA5_9FLAO|nr:amidohydrolase [Flavobacterium pallidum]AWI27179.1 amidohydrolase [Flavobacterium pallidum]